MWDETISSMLKKMNTGEEETKSKEISQSLEEVGLDMANVIGVSFFDEINIACKVFQKTSKAVFDQDKILLPKFVMFGSSSLEKECKKKTFVLAEKGFYKLKVHYIFVTVIT